MHFNNLILTGFLYFLFANAFAQETITPIEKKSEEIFTIVEQLPFFPGGKKALDRYIENNLIYPERAKENRIEGEVIVSFTVQKDGVITDAIIVKDVGFGCGEEALRLVNEMPKWNPGEQRGKPIVAGYKLPVRFEFSKYVNRNSVNEFEKEDEPVLKDFEQAKFGLGFTAGWDNAYGNFGGEASFRLTRFLEANAGFGIGFAGLNIGIGSRIYIPKAEFSPFVGLHLVYALNDGGESTQTTNGETCVYQRNSNQAIFLNGGLKFPVFFNKWLFITGGYSWTFNKNDFNFIRGVNTSGHRKFMEVSGLGGIQVAFTLIYYIK